MTLAEVVDLMKHLKPEEDEMSEPEQLDDGEESAGTCRCGGQLIATQYGGGKQIRCDSCGESGVEG